jgi:hypothetical protein
MAFAATDGKKFTNRPPMMAHNRGLQRQSGMEKADPVAQPGEGGNGMEQDGAAIAAEHGPAHEVHVMHDHEGGQHHVHSMHPSGHEHHSEHASAGEAHDHAKKLAGGGQEESDGNEAEMDEPEYE